MGTTTAQTHRTEKEGDAQPEPLAEEIFLPGSGKVPSFAKQKLESCPFFLPNYNKS